MSTVRRVIHTMQANGEKAKRAVVDRRAALQRSFERNSIAGAAKAPAAPPTTDASLEAIPESFQKSVEAVKEVATEKAKVAAGLGQAVGAMLQTEISKRVNRVSLGGALASMGETLSNGFETPRAKSSDVREPAVVDALPGSDSQNGDAPEPKKKAPVQLVDRRQSLTRKLQGVNEQRDESNSEEQHQLLKVIREDECSPQELVPKRMDEQQEDDQGFSLTGPVFSDDEGSSSPGKSGSLSAEDHSPKKELTQEEDAGTKSDDQGSSSPQKNVSLSTGERSPGKDSDEEGEEKCSPAEDVKQDTSPCSADELSTGTRSTSASPARTAGSDPASGSSQTMQVSAGSSPSCEEDLRSSERRDGGAEAQSVDSHHDVAPDKSWKFEGGDGQLVANVDSGPEKPYQYSSGSKQLSQKEIQGLIAKGGLSADEVRRLQKECLDDGENNEQVDAIEKQYQYSSGSKHLSQKEIQGLIAKGGLSADEIRRLQKESLQAEESCEQEAVPEKQYQYSSGSKRLSQQEIQGLISKGGLRAEEIRRLQRESSEDVFSSKQEASPMKKGYQFSSGGKQLSAKEIEATLAKGYLDSKEVRRLREELRRLQASEAEGDEVTASSEVVPCSRPVKAAPQEEEKRVSVRDRASQFQAKKIGESAPQQPKGKNGKPGPAPESLGQKASNAHTQSQNDGGEQDTPSQNAPDAQNQNDAGDDAPSQNDLEASESK